MVNLMYSLCNRYQWFTCGTCSQYEKLFDMVREGWRAKDLALVIYICSEGYSEKQILSVLKREGFK